MVLVNVLLTIFNAILIVGAYFFIRRSVQRQVVNRDVLAEIKKEVNGIIVNINETTMNNVSLIEEKAANLNRLIALADKRAHGLAKVELKQVQPVRVKEPVAAAKTVIIDKRVDEQVQPVVNNKSYSPQKVVQQSRMTGEKLLEERRRNEEKRQQLLKEVEGLPIVDKVRRLGEKGFTEDEVRRILKMDRGEFEMLLNFENLQL